MQPQLPFFPDDFRCSFIFCGEAITKNRLQDVFGGRTSTTLSASKADIWKHVPMQIAVNQCTFLKLRFNKPTVCFLRRREVFYSVLGGSLIPALRSCSSIDLAHDPTCMSRFEYVLCYIYNLHKHIFKKTLYVSKDPWTFRLMLIYTGQPPLNRYSD